MYASGRRLYSQPSGCPRWQPQKILTLFTGGGAGVDARAAVVVVLDEKEAVAKVDG